MKRASSLTRILAEEGLSKSARYNWRDVAKMEPEKAKAALMEISTRAGRKARARLDGYWAAIDDLKEKAAKLEKGWKKWDWEILEEQGIVTSDEADFASEVLERH